MGLLAPQEALKNLKKLQSRRNFLLFRPAENRFVYFLTAEPDQNQRKENLFGKVAWVELDKCCDVTRTPFFIFFHKAIPRCMKSSQGLFTLYQ